MKTLLTLYSTSGCHLCEQAEALVLPLLSGQSLQLQVVEISGDDALLERYGLRIPVLGCHAGNGEWQELGWPFDQPQLWSWLGQLNLMCQGS